MNPTIHKVLAMLVASILFVAFSACTYVGADPGEADGDPTSAWIANPTDCICGLDDPRLVSRPAVVDYPRVLYATPEMKKMREKGIDPESPAGIQLRSQAVDRIRVAADAVRTRDGYCSVWKAIRHRDGRLVADVSAQVMALF